MKNNFDLIIALSHLMNQKGELSLESQKRANTACDWFLKGEANFILFSGWAYRPDSSLTIADMMTNYQSKKYNIDEKKILLSKKSRDTVGDAVFLRLDFNNYLKKKKIAVITSDYHVKRAQIIFDFVFGKEYKIKVYGVSINSDNRTKKREDLSLNEFKRTFDGINKGDIDGIYKRLITAHPYYNGDIYGSI